MKQRIAFAIIMASITTGIVSLTAIAVNIGFNPVFLSIWLRSWLISYVVAVPLIIILGPKVQLLVNYLFRAKQEF